MIINNKNYLKQVAAFYQKRHYAFVNLCGCMRRVLEMQ